MSVKAVYEDGVFKPKEPVDLEEHAEVELDIRTPARPAASEGDPRSFVGFLKGGIKGMPVAAHHDKFLDQDQYAHLRSYLRPLMATSKWAKLSREEQLQQFIQACKAARPDLNDLWDDMDAIPAVWSNAFEYCARTLEQDEAVRRG